MDMESKHEPLDLAVKSAPANGLVAQLLIQAIRDKADVVTFKLDRDLHLKTKDAWESVMATMKLPNDPDDFISLLNSQPKAFQIIFRIGDKKQNQTPIHGNLFEPTVRILLLAVEVPYWIKGDVSAGFETVNPVSKWLLESKDLTRQVELRRVRSI